MISLVYQQTCFKNRFSYVVSYAEPNYGEPQRLTQGGYSHAVTLNEVINVAGRFVSHLLLTDSYSVKVTDSLSFRVLFSSVL